MIRNPVVESQEIFGHDTTGGSCRTEMPSRYQTWGYLLCKTTGHFNRTPNTGKLYFEYNGDIAIHQYEHQLEDSDMPDTHDILHISIRT